MGYSSWSDSAFRSVASRRSSAGAEEIFRKEPAIDPLMNPYRVTVREARDSEHHPRSVPVIVAFDVTASMGHIPTRFAKESLGRLMNQLVENGWVTDPQLLFGAVGDAVSDRAPLQVGQFESGLEMDLWLTRIWLESGGGDLPESYLLAHWFAAHHTASDAWEKRRKKGYLFTIGDAPNKALTPPHVRRVFGYAPMTKTDDTSVIASARARWNVFHILVSSSGGMPPSSVVEPWKELLGQGLLVLDKDDAINELIGAVLGLCERSLTVGQAERLLVSAGVDAALAGECVAQIANFEVA
jgi:hypothetical protein